MDKPLWLRQLHKQKGLPSHLHLDRLLPLWHRLYDVIHVELGFCDNWVKALVHFFWLELRLDVVVKELLKLRPNMPI